jgi:hypothetical protein
MTGPNALGVAGSLIILVALFEMMRRHRLREKYAVIWFFIAVCALVVAAFPSLLTWATGALGLQVPANLLFFVASLVLLILTLQHSYELGRVEERTRTLAEEVALLRLEIDRLTRADRSQQPPADTARG